MIYKIMYNGSRYKCLIKTFFGWREEEAAIYVNAGFMGGYERNWFKTKQEIFDHMKKKYGESAQQKVKWIDSPGDK